MLVDRLKGKVPPLDVTATDHGNKVCFVEPVKTA